MLNCMVITPNIQLTTIIRKPLHRSKTYHVFLSTAKISVIVR